MNLTFPPIASYDCDSVFVASDESAKHFRLGPIHLAQFVAVLLAALFNAEESIAQVERRRGHAGAGDVVQYLHRLSQESIDGRGFPRYYRRFL